MGQAPFGEVMEGLNVNRECCYLNWTLKDTEEGHLKLDKEDLGFL